MVFLSTQGQSGSLQAVRYFFWLETNAKAFFLHFRKSQEFQDRQVIRFYEIYVVILKLGGGGVYNSPPPLVYEG